MHDPKEDMNTLLTHRRRRLDGIAPRMKQNAICKNGKANVTTLGGNVTATLVVRSRFRDLGFWVRGWEMFGIHRNHHCWTEVMTISVVHEIVEVDGAVEGDRGTHKIAKELHATDSFLARVDHVFTAWAEKLERIKKQIVLDEEGQWRCGCRRETLRGWRGNIWHAADPTDLQFLTLMDAAIGISIFLERIHIICGNDSNHVGSSISKTRPQGRV